MADSAEQGRREAAAVLRHAAAWEMSPARWTVVSGLLDALDAAHSSGDAEALTAATVALELAGPVRIVRIGSTPVGPAPPPIRERVNQLIYRLSGPAGSDGAPRGGEAAQPGISPDPEQRAQ